MILNIDTKKYFLAQENFVRRHTPTQFNVYVQNL
jgi:hypothetical protein